MKYEFDLEDDNADRYNEKSDNVAEVRVRDKREMI